MPHVSALLLLCCSTSSASQLGYDAMLRHIVGCGGFVGPVAIRQSALGFGFGCYTTREIEADELLFIVPARLQISAPTALLDTVCGAGFDDERPVAAIAGFMAMSVLCRSLEHLPYLSTLAASPDETHVLWWTSTEMALLLGTSAHEEATELRAEADEAVAATLSNEPLRDAVALALQDETDQRAGADAGEVDKRLSEAVRAAYSCILSRAFGVHDLRFGPNNREMVPILDMLQHGGGKHSVTYSDEVIDEVFDAATEAECNKILATPNHPSLCCEVRANRRLRKGSELTTDYGAHPDFVFGSHYSFSMAGEAAHAAYATAEAGQARASALDALGTCAAKLRLEAVATEMAAKCVLASSARVASMGIQTALSAQRAAESMDAEAAASAWNAMRKRSLRRRRRGAARGETPVDPFDALATLLAATGPSASIPLKFVLTSSTLDDALSDAAASGQHPGQRPGQRPQGGGASIDAMLCCARLCMLDEADLRSMGDERSGERSTVVAAGDAQWPSPDVATESPEPSPDVATERLEPLCDVEAKRLMTLALSRLTASRSGQLSIANDRRAAALLYNTATRAIDELDSAAPSAATAGAVRPACWDLALSLRRSERFALGRLRDSASELFAQEENVWYP